MSSKHVLVLIFSSILLTLLCVTGYASTQQALWDWRGLTAAPDRWWTLATLLDAYFGFITFYVWVWFKERSSLARMSWFVAIMAFGNMAMAIYVLWQLSQLRANEPVSAILHTRNTN